MIKFKRNNYQNSIEFYKNEISKKYPFSIKMNWNDRYPEDYVETPLTKLEFFKLLGYMMKFAEENKFI